MPSPSRSTPPRRPSRETLNRAPIAIVDEDHSPLSTRIVGAFYPPFFMPPELITQAEMDARMDAGLDTFALDIPPGFQRDVLAGRNPTIQLNVDATRISQAFTGAGYIQAIVTERGGRLRASATGAAGDCPVDLALRARFNPTLEPSLVRLRHASSSTRSRCCRSSSPARR